MSKYVCEMNACTGCNACVNICPRNAIHFFEDLIGNINMKIDEDLCVDCGLCAKVCPNCNKQELSYPMKAYAVWNKKSEIRNNAASGGVASSLYRFAISEGYSFCGVEMNDNMEAHYCIGNSFEDIEKFRNSKYTFSFTDDIYRKIYELLKNGDDFLFIGLPCQVAGLKNYLAVKPNTDGKVFLVDIVCHGTPPSKYLKEHVESISKKYRQKTKKCLFRDPKYGTSHFIFSLFDSEFSGKSFYSRKVKSGDTYQIGYHKAYIYKDNCYECKFARNERISDLTISDYRWNPICDEKEEISNVLVNTKRGELLLSRLKDFGEIECVEYPLDTALKLDKQLNSPSKRSETRKIFVDNYLTENNFERAAKKAFSNEIRKNRVCSILHVDEIKDFVKCRIPKPIKVVLKKTMHMR